MEKIGLFWGSNTGNQEEAAGFLKEYMESEGAQIDEYNIADTDPKKMLDAAKAMKLSAKDLLELNVIDEIILEPTGGAHRDKNLMLENVRDSLKKNIDSFETMPPEEIFNERKNKFLRIGRNKGFMNNSDDLSSLKVRKKDLRQIFRNFKILIPVIGLLLVSLILLINYL